MKQRLPGMREKLSVVLNFAVLLAGSVCSGR